MDHNRRGLALMTAALLISVLVASLRGCNDRMAHRLSDMDVANQKLIRTAARLTRPITGYRIRSIDEGVMTVEAGPSLSAADLKSLAVKLTRALRDADEKELNSEMVFVQIYRSGTLVCKAQTSIRGIWVKVGTDGPGEYVSP
ncbi:MAG: hypothetical protein LC772_00955 [Chloroflexi bacterium]|nr:hypothetical protein [Chloroflexota bacterium]